MKSLQETKADSGSLSAQDRERETTIHKYQKQSYKDCYQIDYASMGNYFQILVSSL